jgi:pyruvate dehydrogenase E1 component alpha subunit
MLLGQAERDRGRRVTGTVDDPAGSAAVRLIGPDGRRTGTAEIHPSHEELRALLRWMILARRLDQECVALAREGELITYPGFEGQEAAQVGAAFALGTDDMVFPTFRELAMALVRGVDPVAYLRYHRGTWHGAPYDPIVSGFAPICVPTGTQLPHAAGWALGAKLDGSDAVALGCIGDGATSEGDFHEAANLAAVWDAPLVIVCQNNRWAITTPIGAQMKGQIWTRAEGYGFPGVRVDGNDVLAVLQVTRAAVERARSGGGPTLIEALTYRIGPHSTNDDASRYRDADEVDLARRLDPITRYRAFLLSEAIVDEAFVVEREREAEALAEQVRAAIVAIPPPPADELFDFVYAAPPEPFERQRREAVGRSSSRSEPGGTDRWSR